MDTTDVLVDAGCTESNTLNRFLCELEVTVCTGFEVTAKEEIGEKIVTASDVTAARGRVNMFVPINDSEQVRCFEI